MCSINNQQALAGTSAVVAETWHSLGLNDAALGWLRLEGRPLQGLSSFRVDTAAQAAIAASGLAFAEFRRLRGGEPQTVLVDCEHAFAEFRSESLITVNDERQSEFRDRISGLYRTEDGWVRVHANFPHHRDGVLALLESPHSPTEVQRRLLGWKAEAFENAAAAKGLCVSALRNVEAWDAHPHAAVVASQPLVLVEKVGDAPRPTWPLGARPLSGVRVLDLTRVIAGPVCSRTLAAHGADVLQVTADHLPTIAALDVDTGRGKRRCSLDLRQPAARQQFEALLASANVLVDSYRPGSLKQLGFGWRDAVAARPGLIHASLSAYGESGPWGGRRGYDSLVQTATGFNTAEAAAFGETRPRPLPAQVLDHASGYLLALGIASALIRQIAEGGSWRVHVSLVRTGLWLRSLGRVAPAAAPAPASTDVARFRASAPSAAGVLSFIDHAARLSQTPAHWHTADRPSSSREPAWAAESP
jgi:crotonobetainyl-CoA:carnitine CoA-transferase CaiB-like acyl-CoA transferase